MTDALIEFDPVTSPVNVSEHAIIRWRERYSVKGGRDEIIAAVRASEPAPVWVRKHSTSPRAVVAELAAGDEPLSLAEILEGLIAYHGFDVVADTLAGMHGEGN